MASYLAVVVAANYTAAHCPPLQLAGLAVPLGAVATGLTLTLRDLLTETVTTATMLLALAAAAVLSAEVASPTVAAASALAFLVSEAIDAWVYARLRHRSRIAAAAASNGIGLLVDTALFLPLAFGNWALTPGHLLGKTLSGALSVGLLACLLRVWSRRRR
ncbi:VUT family protein [Crossiella sp. SN42]|uniref:VUT family protein n=1 Tax=Crossiella sp. SN42 TaxID=2944808 RepID=UPI00207C4A7D|nr:VUT family protein [Crossiella sp. SN42]MCO1575913.1 VUT family protein [Crossiella sp. SN42]